MISFEELAEMVLKEDFNDVEIRLIILEAKDNPAKMEEIKKIFFE